MAVKKNDKQNKAKRPSPQDFERVGRMMEAVVASGYLNKKRLAGVSFIKGVFFGVGSALGASIVVSIVLWLLKVLYEVSPLDSL